jgi:hypothetical protein
MSVIAWFHQLRCPKIRLVRRIKGITLLIVGILLSSIVIATPLVQWNAPLNRWFVAVDGLLLSLGLGLDFEVLSLSACAAVISGILFLTRDSSKSVIIGWQLVRFLLHLAAVYAIASCCTPRLAGWTKAFLLPLLKVPTESSNFQFLFSHIFEFSFIPALIAGFANARFNHNAARYVWLVPTIVLAYEFVTYQTPPRSVLDSASPAFPNLLAAFRQYFGGGFLIGEYHDLHDFWQLVGPNPDVQRGMTQLKFTAPFYASIGYSLAAWLALRFQVLQKLVERAKAWEQSRLDRS